MSKKSDSEPPPLASEEEEEYEEYGVEDLEDLIGSEVASRIPATPVTPVAPVVTVTPVTPNKPKIQQPTRSVRPTPKPTPPPPAPMRESIIQAMNEKATQNDEKIRSIAALGTAQILQFKSANVEKSLGYNISYRSEEVDNVRVFNYVEIPPNLFIDKPWPLLTFQDIRKGHELLGSHIKKTELYVMNDRIGEVSRQLQLGLDAIANALEQIFERCFLNERAETTIREKIKEMNSTIAAFSSKYK